MIIRGLANWVCKPVSKQCPGKGFAWAGYWQRIPGQNREPASAAFNRPALPDYFSVPNESQEHYIHLAAKNVLNRWNQVIMMAEEDDLGLFGQGLKGFKTCF
jgi:hypothetical protein